MGQLVIFVGKAVICWQIMLPKQKLFVHKISPDNTDTTHYAVEDRL